MLALLYKDMRDELGLALFGFGGLLAWCITFTALSRSWKLWASGLILWSLFGVLIAASVMGYLAFRREWERNSAALLLTLPVSRWLVLLSKSSVGFAQLLLMCGVVFVSLRLSLWLGMGKSYDLSWGETLKLLLFWAGGAFPFYTLALFAFISSRTLHRFRPLLAILVFVCFIALYVWSSRYSPWLFGFMPKMLFAFEGNVQPAADFSPYWYWLTFGGVLWTLSGLTLSRGVEVT